MLPYCWSLLSALAVFLVGSSRFSIYMIMSSANIYFLFSPDALYLFFLCNCFPGASNTLLCGNGGSRHLCHVPDPREKGFGLSAFIMYVCYSRDFHWCPLSDWGNPLFPPGLLSISFLWSRWRGGSWGPVQRKETACYHPPVLLSRTPLGTLSATSRPDLWFLPSKLPARPQLLVSCFHPLAPCSRTPDRPC